MSQQQNPRPAHELQPRAGDARHPQEEVELVLRRWHDDTHPGAWATCLDEPCRAAVRVLHGPTTHRSDQLALVEGAD